MKIAIVTGSWKRHNLFSVFCEYYQELQKKVPFTLIVAVSEIETEQIAKQYGHTTVFAPNEPLGEKFNAATKAARGYDYTLNIGSDDFLTEGFLRHYIELMGQGFDYIGVLDWWFFDSKTKQGLYWNGYDTPRNKGNCCGAGRALSKRLLEEMDYRPWPPGFDRVLDTGFQKMLNMITHTEHVFNMREAGIFAIDVKTSQNMTMFARWDNTFLMDGPRLLRENLPEYANKITNLCAG